MRATTLALAVLIAATATTAQSADLYRMYRCVGSSGETVYADRQAGTDCRELWIEPSGNSGWLSVDPDTVQVAEPAPTPVRASVPALPGQIK